MNKIQYMQTLEDLIMNSDVDNKFEILAECEQEINKFLGYGMSMDAIIKDIGTPEQVFENVSSKHEENSNETITADSNSVDSQTKEEPTKEEPTKEEPVKEDNKENENKKETFTEKYDEVKNSETVQNVKEMANKGKNEIVNVFNKLAKTTEDEVNNTSYDKDNNRILVLIIFALLFITLTSNKFILMFPIAIFDFIFKIIVIGSMVMCLIYLFKTNKNDNDKKDSDSDNKK